MDRRRYLLDTHILLRVTYEALDSTRTTLLSEPGVEIGYSQISLWEFAKLYEKKRLTLLDGFKDLMDTIESHPRLKAIPVSGGPLTHLMGVVDRMHRDPADQIIAATALYWDATLITDDQQLRKLAWLKTA